MVDSSELDFQFKLKIIVESNFSYASVLRQIGWKINGTTYAKLKFLIKKYNLDITHFTNKGWAKGKTKENNTSLASASVKMRLPDEYLFSDNSIYSRKSIKRRMVEIGTKYECVKCFNKGEWLGEKLSLDLDHINGNPLDNRLENLRFLCPNCHRQTRTFGSKNRQGFVSNSQITNKEGVLVKNILKAKENLVSRLSDPVFKKFNKSFTKPVKTCFKCLAKLESKRKSGLCINCYKEKRRSDIPPLETLLRNLENSSYRAVGIKYGVTDNAVRKWFKSYGVDPKTVKRASSQYNILKQKEI